jgi:hypothetical protein
MEISQAYSLALVLSRGISKEEVHFVWDTIDYEDIPLFIYWNMQVVMYFFESLIKSLISFHVFVKRDCLFIFDVETNMQFVILGFIFIILLLFILSI